MKTAARSIGATAIAICLLGIVAAPSLAGPQNGDPHAMKVYTGYADDLHGGTTFIPSPWAGDANVVFQGSGSPFDAGAIRIDNPSNQTLTVQDVVVDIGGVTYALWTFPAAVPPKSTLILTQTTQFDFDTSEPGITTCDPTGTIPTVSITVGAKNQSTKVFADAGQVLNTGGIDLGACPDTNEGHAWSRVHPVD
jgi:hypothetical protein